MNMSGAPTYEIEEDCFFHAIREDDQLTVYRSIIVRDTDEIYQPVFDLIGDAELIHRETVVDPGMAFGRAELSIYRTEPEHP